MENNETTAKDLATASLEAAADLIIGVKAGPTINAMRTRMHRVADDLAEAAFEKLKERRIMTTELHDAVMTYIQVTGTDIAEKTKEIAEMTDDDVEGCKQFYERYGEAI